jgi:hypothetical protein
VATGTAGSKEDQSPVLVASHGVVDRGSNRLEPHGVEEGAGRPTGVGSCRVSKTLPPSIALSLFSSSGCLGLVVVIDLVLI